MDHTGSSASSAVEIRRAPDQFVTRRNGIVTRHCFSFGEHYDPERVRVGPLVALNDETIPAGSGYAPHEHRDLDIVTWVLEGVLQHEDSLGTSTTMRNGTTQRLTAGRGVTHSETNAGTSTLRFLQLWFSCDETVSSTYETSTFDDEDQWFGWTRIAGDGAARSGTTLAVPGVEVSVCHLTGASTDAIPGAGPSTAQAFTYVASGTLSTHEHGILEAGDSVRNPGPALHVVAIEDAVLLSVAFSRGTPDR